MKMTPWFIHQPSYDFLLSDEYNLSYIQNCPGSSKLFNGSELNRDSEVQKSPSFIKVLHMTPAGCQPFLYCLNLLLFCFPTFKGSSLIKFFHIYSESDIKLQTNKHAVKSMPSKSFMK